MTRIATLDQHPEFLETVVEWIVEEWGSSRQDIKETLVNNRACPPALVAMNHVKPIGVLGYKLYVLEPRGSTELWINTLFVTPDFRRLGVGKQLVQEAMDAAARSDRESLFVYTDIPEFYEPLGWQRFRYVEKVEMHVLETKVS